MSRYLIKKWDEFQHYKDRSPPWVKLHRQLLDDFDFQCLPLASKALAPMLWLLASETDDGSIEGDPARLAFRLRWPLSDVEQGLSALIEKEFLIDASTVLAERLPTENRGQSTEGEKTKAPGKPARFDPESLPMPYGLKAEKWSEWIDYRRKRKLSTTEPTAKKQLAMLASCIAKGFEAAQIIDTSIEKGWQGLFEPKARDGPRAVTGRQSAVDNYAAQAAAARGDHGKPATSETVIEGTATRVA